MTKRPSLRYKEAQVDKFLEDTHEFTQEAQARYQEYRGRRGKELEQWHHWDQKGRKPEHAAPLLQSMKPLIKNETNKRLTGLGGSIPRAALENELTISAMKSFQTYDPQRGVALPTHVSNGFRRVADFENKNRNVKYMPSADVKRYGAFRNVTGELENELGRPPTAQEIKQRAPNWSEPTIRKMQRGFGRELYTDMGGADSMSIHDPHEAISPRQAFQLTRTELSPEEQRFGNLFFPPEGEAPQSIKNVAKALGISESRAYTLRANVESRMGKVLKRE